MGASTRCDTREDPPAVSFTVSGGYLRVHRALPAAPAGIGSVPRRPGKGRPRGRGTDKEAVSSRRVSRPASDASQTLIRFAADENFNHDIIRGLSHRAPSIEIVSVQQTGLAGADDAAILEWATVEGLVLLSHDGRTLPDEAAKRIGRGLRVAGVIIVPMSLGIGAVVADLELIALASTRDEWVNVIQYLPLD